MLYHRSGRLGVLLVLCLSSVAFLLAGCSSAPQATVNATSTPGTTALKDATPIITPASSTGWPVYTDRRFPFRFPVPPGWVAGSHTDAYYATTNCEYVVDLFPQGSNTAFIPGAEEKHSEEMFLKINLACPPNTYTPAHDSHLAPEPASVLFNGKPVTLYGNTDTAVPPSRVVSAMFGGHQYLFALSAPSAAAGSHDIALFLGVLAGFHYTGA